MNSEDKRKLLEERESYLNKIIQSEADKKIIVAGPGTGKTYTFSQIFKSKGSGNFLALTFIRNLAESLALELGDGVEARTFHSFCKRILHEQKGMVSIFPELSKIIEYDASLINPELIDFIKKFQTLEEDCEEIKFFLARGDYYKWLSFEDSVYRLYKILKEDKSILPRYDQIVIDEYQDFNALEVAFINELESKGPILIVGDDDQALYISLKNASPDFIREKYKEGKYERFELPFCSRCPEVIVNLVNSFIDRIQRGKRLQDRIYKNFRPFTPDNEDVSSLYNMVKYVELSMISSIVKYISLAIEKIPLSEVEESYKKNYPTVLILGSPHYLEQIKKGLLKKFTNIEHRASDQDKTLTIIHAYEILIVDIHSNLGWRILCEVSMGSTILTDAILRSVKGDDFETLLEQDLVANHKNCIELIKEGREGTITPEEVKSGISDTLGSYTDRIMDHFLKKEEEEEKKLEEDTSQPKILLTTYVGSKGLSGGHVFITCFWDGELPKVRQNDGRPFVDDVEISKFIVALTRTRKECHLIYNKWMFQPKAKNGKSIPQNTRSCFLRLLSDDYVENLGLLNSTQMDAYFSK